MYHNPALWPMTSDGFVPYKTFFLLWAAVDAVMATDQYVIANAVSLGYAHARVGKGDPGHGKVSAAMRDLRRRAFPLVADATGELINPEG